VLHKNADDRADRRSSAAPPGLSSFDFAEPLVACGESTDDAVDLGVEAIDLAFDASYCPMQFFRHRRARFGQHTRRPARHPNREPDSFRLIDATGTVVITVKLWIASR
jgi:hypothetical protein